MDSIEIGNDDPGEDPSSAPEGAEGDGSRVDLPPDATTKPDPSDEGTEGEEGDRPEWLDEKFESPEDLATAYQELQKKMGSDDDGDDEGDTDTDTGEDVEAPEGVSLEDIAAEYEEKGSLSDETYEKFEKAGLGKDVVDSFVESQVNQADQLQQTVMDEVGGEESFRKMQEWASANLSEEQVKAFNSAVTSGDPEMAKLAARGLRADYVEANGSDPDLVQGKSRSRGGSVQPYNSSDEVVEAMKDPRYDRDPAYRKKVDERLRVTEM